MSHYEYCQSKGLSKDEFNKIIRGFYLNGNLIFYKDNFIYDDLIKESLTHVNEIASILKLDEFNIYFGQLPENNFAPDFYYGKYINSNIQKNVE